MPKYTHDKNYIYYKNTNIPINKYNIHDLQKLEREERKLLLNGYKYFHTKLSEKTIFDESYLMELHRRTFSALYSFAGKYRTVNISKGYTTFCQVKFLEQSSKEIFNKLAADNYLKDFANKPREKFAQKISYFMCEMIALHHFFELNGRTTRLFFDMIVTYNGYEYIDYKDALKIEEVDNKYISASIDCLEGDGSKMFQIVLHGLKKSN